MLFDLFIDFWSFWLGSSLTDQTTLQLLSVASTIAFVYGVIFYPIIRIFKGRKK